MNEIRKKKNGRGQPKEAKRGVGEGGERRWEGRKQLGGVGREGGNGSTRKSMREVAVK